ncbi:hypothetical protein J1N35_036448 [Gossypium stocksii]|uniref:RNase H type-1 domain-containing protein n=1 Tax=Gossypium stocksii TaxID=47602 RepID=A0A9D3ZKQ4_9ROSI|nr:hypothetical protein J1N35_036448 [Gossypium stocksii]
MNLATGSLVITDMGAGSALQAELLVVLEGLNIAWQRGYRKVVVESENNVVVQLTSRNSMERCLPSLKFDALRTQPQAAGR